jgi:glutamine amidotransferase-like uncharacterized protein
MLRDLPNYGAIPLSEKPRQVVIYDDTDCVGPTDPRVYPHLPPGPSASKPGLAQIQYLLRESGFETVRLTRDQLNDPKTDLKRYSALVFGGGYAYRGYTGGITEEAKHRMREAIAEEGLGYVGICAGSFFASTDIGWDPRPGGIELPYNRWGIESGYTLKVYPGAAVGPLRGKPPYPWWANTPVRPEGAGLEAVVWDADYAAGPRFVSHWNSTTVREVDDLTTVLARYHLPGNWQDGAPAVVRRPFGKGWVLLSGPHWEGNPDRPVGSTPGFTSFMIHQLWSAILDPSLRARFFPSYVELRGPERAGPT